MRPRVAQIVIESMRVIGGLPGYFRAGDSTADALANAAIALRRLPESVAYRLCLGRLPNYVNPKTYTEKIQWRKLFDRRAHIAVLSDKLAAKDFARTRSPSVAVPETLWAGTDPDAIPFDRLTPPYVVKATNRSRAVMFVWDDDDLDTEAVRATCRRWMRARAHKAHLYEWAYGRVAPRLIVERLLRRADGPGSPPDLKVLVFGGTAAYLTSRDLVTGVKTMRDRRGNPLAWNRWKGYPVAAPEEFESPTEPLAGAEALFQRAEEIGAGMDHVRVDFYLVDGTIYFGETTFYVSSGHKPYYRRDAEFDRFPPDDVDRMMGDLWVLPPLARRIVLWRGLVGRRRPEPAA